MTKKLKKENVLRWENAGHSLEKATFSKNILTKMSKRKLKKYWDFFHLINFIFCIKNSCYKRKSTWLDFLQNSNSKQFCVSLCEKKNLFLSFFLLWSTKFFWFSFSTLTQLTQDLFFFFSLRKRQNLYQYTTHSHSLDGEAFSALKLSDFNELIGLEVPGMTLIGDYQRLKIGETHD